MHRVRWTGGPGQGESGGEPTGDWPRFGGSVLVLSLILVLLSGLFCTDAFAYKRIGSNVKWKKVQDSWPQYKVNLDYSWLTASWRTQAYNSRMEWNDTGASKLYFYSVNPPCKNTICMSAQLPSGVLAQTHVSWDGDGYIISAPIAVNSNKKWHTDGTWNDGEYDARSVLTHEIGHVLGLDDLDGSADTEKTMYYQVATRETKKQTLASDDISGIRAIYGSK